ncbi:MAG TPA: D-alanine--D-alanine ligase [Sedimentisphaerales bacterium]|nr:D-alanine--D-alanine ligase [Sedimentisphaerales bacterium]
MLINKSLKVAVLAGGVGSERQVSLTSGKNVAQAINDAGLNVVTSDISPDDMSILCDKSIDVFFLALHGRFGEDGQLQRILEDKGLVYTGCGPEASAVAFDKIASKKAFAGAGVSVPRMLECKIGTDLDKFAEDLASLSNRYVIKPPAEGSSVGVVIANSVDEAVRLSRECLNEFGGCMVEEFIIGREVTVGVLCGRVLPVLEIRAKSGFYDYNAKYVAEDTQFLFDTIEDVNIVRKLQSDAKLCFDAVGCRDISRIDFIVRGEECYCLEVNTIPGFTGHSLLPMAAKKAGISMSQLCMMVIEEAWKRRKK